MTGMYVCICINKWKYGPADREEKEGTENRGERARQKKNPTTTTRSFETEIFLKQLLNSVF